MAYVMKLSRLHINGEAFFKNCGYFCSEVNLTQSRIQSGIELDLTNEEYDILRGIILLTKKPIKFSFSKKYKGLATREITVKIIQKIRPDNNIWRIRFQIGSTFEHLEEELRVI